MTLLGIHSLSKSFGTHVLFEDLSFTISEGDRIGLLGPNGSGKSTLMKILASHDEPDTGHLTKRQGLTVGYASQAAAFEAISIEDVLLQAALPSMPDDVERSTAVAKALSRAEFTDFAACAQNLSGGWKKRLDIARAVMLEPDMLLLDEPTNHLDIEGIFWLEKLLTKHMRTYLVVSHDRYFLKRCTNKIIELGSCYEQGLFMTDGNLDTFLEHKRGYLEAQIEEERSLRASVRQEVAWMKKSPKARTTKSRARMQQAEELIDELAAIKRRTTKKVVSLTFTASERETKKLLTAKNLTKSTNDRLLFRGVDLTLSPGSCLGIVGKNGTGKTTLLKILAGELAQDMGTVKYADDLTCVYFDQHREQVPLDISLREALCPQGDMVNYRGQYIHVNGWAKKFLFSPERLQMPVKYLSGGELARIQIARLMLKPADVLFLDEPTNDLDIQTLEVIEETLQEFQGAIVIISHDRCLMDTICTQILALDHINGHAFFADYKQWQQAQGQGAEPSKRKSEVPSQPAVAPAPQKPAVPVTKKLSYKEQKELESMEHTIHTCEQEIARLQHELETPRVQNDVQMTHELCWSLHQMQEKRDALYKRWETLLS